MALGIDWHVIFFRDLVANLGGRVKCESEGMKGYLLLLILHILCGFIFYYYLRMHKLKVENFLKDSKSILNL